MSILSEEELNRRIEELPLPKKILDELNETLRSRS